MSQLPDSCSVRLRTQLCGSGTACRFDGTCIVPGSGLGWKASQSCGSGITSLVDRCPHALRHVVPEGPKFWREEQEKRGGVIRTAWRADERRGAFLPGRRSAQAVDFLRRLPRVARPLARAPPPR